MEHTRTFDAGELDELISAGRLADVGTTLSAMPAGDIAARFDVSRTAISQHITVLKDAGLLAERREGTRRIYRARPEGIDRLRDLLDDMWASSLDVARQLVEAERGLTDDDEVNRAG